MNRRLFVGACAVVPAWCGSLLRLSRTDGVLEEIDPSQYQATVLLFLSTVCPISNAYQDRIQTLIKQFENRPVRFLLINANQTESADETQRYAEDVAFPIPFYKDWRNIVADRFGVTLTPESVVLDSHGIAVYRGAIDDARNPARVKVKALESAVEGLLAGRPLSVNPVRAFGCAIKKVT